MRNKAKILIIAYVGLIIFGFIIVNSVKSELSFTLPEDITRSFTMTKTVSIEKDKIFQSMSNFAIYPVVLPDNVKNVRIINQTENALGGLFRYAEIEVQEMGISTSFIVYQETTKTDKNFLQIRTGDAKGTEVTQIFESVDSETKITNHVVMRVKGILLPFGLIPSGNVEHAMNTVITSFVDYVQNH